MADINSNTSKKELPLRHRGRIGQIGIYFTKFLRMFVYQSDWIGIPMTALIAGLVAFVMGRRYTVTMEGTMTGTFALVCVCIWNGCFNSIQVICRERDVVKREHRAGMHISSYIISHMLYQFLLCLIQTIITLWVTKQVGMNYPTEGYFTKWFIVDFGFTMFLITYAADMMSLFISSISRTTTTAMTIMPFVLVFQLIFSGGVITLPAVAEPIAILTVSNPGFRAMASQADVNSRRYGTLSRMLRKMDNTEIETSITLGQLLDALGNEDSETVAGLRAIEVEANTTMGAVFDEIMTDDQFADLRKEKLTTFMTVGQALTIMKDEGYYDEYKDRQVSYTTTVGEIVDFLAADESIQARRGEGIPVRTTVGEVLDLVGRDETKEAIDEEAAKANYNPKYEYSGINIVKNWLHLLFFIFLFSALSIIILENIDKDKR